MLGDADPGQERGAGGGGKVSGPGEGGAVTGGVAGVVSRNWSFYIFGQNVRLMLVPWLVL